MKISYFTHSLNPRTGAGEFSANLLDQTRSQLDSVTFSVLTSEDLLAPKFFSLLRNFRKIRQVIRDSDLVHALDAYPYGMIAALVNWGINKPLIITAVGSGSLRLLQERGWRGWLLRWAYGRATRIVAISNYVARELHTLLAGREIAVINHGVNADFWQRQETTALDQKLSAYQPYLLTVGEMKPRKGHLAVLPLLAQARKQVSNLRYVVVANPERNPEQWQVFREQVKSLGLEKSVEYLSGLTQAELRTVYQRAAAFVLLPQVVRGDVEGFGLVLLEAAASGTPVIVGRGTGADDAVADGKSGYLLDSSNSERVVEKMVELTQADKRLKLARGSVAWAREMSWDQQIKKYVALYQELQG